jgi:hypothetical protein
MPLALQYKALSLYSLKQKYRLCNHSEEILKVTQVPCTTVWLHIQCLSCITPFDGDRTLWIIQNQPALLLAMCPIHLQPKLPKIITAYYRGYFQALNLYDILHECVYSEALVDIDI